jgi:hypothetical protein
LNALKNIVLVIAATCAIPAMAGSVTATTSANLVGQFTLIDSGEQVYNYTNTFNDRNHQTLTTASVLSTFQDMATAQWYQTTQYTATTSYEFSAQDYSQYYQYGYASISPVAGEQWIELSLTNTTGRTLKYSATMNATLGSKTSPRGNVQFISPAFEVTSDTVPATPSFYLNSPMAISYYTGGSTDTEVRVVGEATDGGTLSFMQIYMYGDTAVGSVRTEYRSYVSNQWTQDVAISTPVPEPETYAMLLAGLGLMGAVARRRKAQANA